MPHLQALLRQVDVLDGQQAGAEGGRRAVADDGGGGGREDVGQKGEGARGQQHEVGAVLVAQEGHLWRQGAG